MNIKDKIRVITRYNKRLNMYGDDIRSLASGTEERRNIRYNVLRDVGIYDGCSVLDLGCGFGDFFGFLRSNSTTVDYVGYDINPDLIALSKAKYPEARFEVRDVQTDAFPNFDFVVSSSAFNLVLRNDENYRFVHEILEICYTHAIVGVAVDFMSAYADFTKPEAFHYQPERIFAMAKSITKRVCLRHDYPLFEFCVYLFKDFDGWRHR